MKNKFKVFDTVEKEWLSEIGVFISGEGKLHYMDVGGFFHTLNPDRYRVCWFTGFKDKSGDEVYGGHLIDYGTSNGFSWGTEYVRFYMVWKECGFFPKNIKSGKVDTEIKITQDIINKVDRFKIIGHIFTDAHLLEGK